MPSPPQYGLSISLYSFVSQLYELAYLYLLSVKLPILRKENRESLYVARIN